MQVLDEVKRRKILDAAAKLFATSDYHNVSLSDIAAEARVGKGTLYIYFKNKEDLFTVVRVDGYLKMYRCISASVDTLNGDPLLNLKAIISEMVEYCYANPRVFTVLRSGRATNSHPELDKTRNKLIDLTATVIKKGIILGVLADSQPEYTANYLLDIVRSGLGKSKGELAKDELITHIYTIFSKALSV